MTTLEPAWGHRQGLLDLQPLTTLEQARDGIAARLLIPETFYRYCWGYDERRLDVLSDLYVEDAIFTLTVGGGEPAAVLRGREEIVAFQGAAMEKQTDQRRHQIGNVVVEQLDLERGRALALALLILTSSTGGDSARLISTGWYRGSLALDAGKWRFADLHHGLDGNWE